MANKKNSIDDGIDRYHSLDLEADTAEQLTSVYAAWADRYDHDNDHKLGTVSQPKMVALLLKHLRNPVADILDVGCGTGIVGMHLAQVGYQNFDGTDLSSEMLAVAQDRGYRTLTQGNANEGLLFADELYDAVVCVGVFTHGHLGAEFLPEIDRVTKPGGLVCFTVNEGVWMSGNFERTINEIVDNGVWQILDCILDDYMINENVRAWYVAARKL